MNVGERQRPELFNSALETGVRATVVLDAVHPRAFDLTHLTWLDHLVVHTADLEGPASLHPDIPQRTGELLVRRRLVEDGLDLMRRLHMVHVEATPTGIVYCASDDSAAFVDSLRTSYGVRLRERAKWLAAFIAQRSDEDLASIVARRINLWTVEFQGDVGIQSSPP